MKAFNKKLVGERIKFLRNEKGIGQNLLAKELQLSNASISYWETGKQEPGAEAIFKIVLLRRVCGLYFRYFRRLKKVNGI